MNPLSLMRQTMTFSARSSYSAQGREVVDSPVTVSCRFQATSKNVMGPNGQLLTIVGIVYVPADTTVNINDKGVFDSVTYRVHSKYAVVDGAGRTNHIKLELVKWQT